MFSPYGIIIMAFTLFSIFMSVRGWRIMSRAKERSRWPTVEGTITHSILASDENDTLPKITFSYQIDDQQFQGDVAMPSEGSISPEFSESYVKKYPVGSKVQVHYNPTQPGQASIEPGGRDDWLVFTMSILGTLFGLGLLIFAR